MAKTCAKMSESLSTRPKCSVWPSHATCPYSPGAMVITLHMATMGGTSSNHFQPVFPGRNGSMSARR